MLDRGKRYWKGAAAQFGSVRMLAVCAMFIALRVAIGALFIPVGENLRVYFTYAVTALGASIYGPFMALAEGFVSDILGYFIAPSGGFFPGYTLSAMLGSVTYALFFYQQRQSFARIFLCRMTVNIVVNILIGSVWSAILMGKGYIYYVSKSIVKNLMLLPIEALVMYTVFRTMNPLLKRMKFIPAEQAEIRTVFKRNKNA